MIFGTLKISAIVFSLNVRSYTLYLVGYVHPTILQLSPESDNTNSVE